jgi:hypothetical protein
LKVDQSDLVYSSTKTVYIEYSWTQLKTQSRYIDLGFKYSSHKNSFVCNFGFIIGRKDKQVRILFIILVIFYLFYFIFYFIKISGRTNIKAFEIKENINKKKER